MRVSRSALLLSVAQILAALMAAAFLLGTSHWEATIAVLLLAFALVGDRLEVEAPVLRISGAFVAVGLAMVILGPVPAAAIGLLTTLADTIQRRVAVNYALSNLATFVAFPLVGGEIVRLASRAWDLQQQDLSFAFIVIGAFVAASSVNFVQISATSRLMGGDSVLRAFRTVYLPLLPSQLAIGVLAAVIVYAHAHGGGAALVLLVGVVVLYQYLLRELLLSKERAEQLGARGQQLASLQVGVLTAMLQTLSLRDKMTARHCAAVARYAKEIAREYGCDDEEQDLVHTAGLLHDIGKFIFPDSILMGGNKLTDEEYEIVKKHPAQGAKVVRGVDGYGPVADIILAHHERIDGRGYPRGIAGDDIPIFSRMISVADTYDVMTARDSYREPVTPAEAVAELRRVSGTQLDAHLVELFIRILQRKGVAFHHGDDADFDRELDLDRRIRDYAAPREPALVAG
jgi:putative nucleotidyltransferase with HDIG domain